MCESDSLDGRLETVLAQQRATTIRILQEGPQDEAALRLAEQVQQELSAATDALPSKARHACAPGCWFCCHLPVDVLTPEAFRIAAHLRRTRGPAELAALVYRLGVQSRQDFGARPCVFLADGRCSIYEVRPLVCRGYNSLSRERCEAFFHDPSIDLKGTKDRIAARLAAAIEDGVIAGLTALGLDAEWYELPNAVLRAMDVSDGPARWARGEAVFEGGDPSSEGHC
jgi:Fe-S-cluster containining protein